MTRARLRAAALRILRAGLAAVEPGRLIREQLSVDGADIRAGKEIVRKPRRIFVVSVGKAAIPMAESAVGILGDRITAALVIAPIRAPSMPRTRSFRAGHPVPDADGVRAGRAVIRLLSQAGTGDLVLLLLSGGASSLMPAPIKGVSLRDKQRVTRLLLQRGATISEINAVRKRLSVLKGGGFARLAAPARVVALALSDVPGDDPRTIGSGPASEDPRATSLARKVMRRFFKAAEISLSVRRALLRPASVRFRRNAKTFVIGSGTTFAKAASDEAKRIGFPCRVLIGGLRGDASGCGPAMVATFLRQRKGRPSCLIATGETVVAVTGPGLGGRNQELALAVVPRLSGLGFPVVLAAFATDGRDGPTRASGGLVDDRTASRARKMEVSIESALNRNDSYRALLKLGQLIVTGPTKTNVADVAIVLG